MDTKDIIKQKRLEKNLTMKKLGELVGVSEATISRWESRNIATMKQIKIGKLCEALNISPNEIVPGIESISSSPTASPSYHAVPSAGMVKIPILGTVIAGYPRYAEENIIGYEDISEEQAKTGEYFCLKVTGTSMLPRFEEGDLLIIKVQDYIENGDIGIVLVDGDNATVKVVHESPVGITLLAYNTAVYQPTTYTREQIETLPVKVIGKVVGLRRDF